MFAQHRHPLGSFLLFHHGLVTTLVHAWRPAIHLDRTLSIRAPNHPCSSPMALPPVIYPFFILKS
ncbi:MAG: hypothetical protein HQL83_13740 [Magnetococcales bacterium]|nr:hypothetical protein [Magnetococcales bacterium]MBF0348410.1 hypothetical protein [Magnetococcales bacterium]